MKNSALIILIILYSMNAHARYLEVYNHAGDGGGKVHVSVLEQIGLGTSALISVTTDYFTIGTEATVGPGTIIGARVKIAPGATVKSGTIIGSGVYIGYGATVAPGVTIGTGSKVGDGALVGSGVVVGSWANIGARTRVGSWVTVGSWANIGGRAVIGSRVVIGEAAVVGDRTRISSGVAVGNGARVGSEARVGYRAVVGASSIVGDRARVGSEVRIEYMARVEDRARIASRTVVCISVPEEVLVEEDQNTEKTECAICWTNMISRVALPCMHFAYCNPCISRINKCALCRLEIEDKCHFQDQDIKEKDAKGEVFRPS